MEEENKYHFAREIIFNLRACHAITDKVYQHWITKLIEDEKQAENNDVLDLVSDCEIDNLLSDLDKDATDYNGYEYGLPICGEWLVTLRTTVRTWLNK